jgi:hypothetical protein
MVKIKKEILGILLVLLSLNFVVAENLLGSGDSQVTLYGGVSCFQNSTHAIWVTGEMNKSIYNSSGYVAGGNCSEYFDSSVSGSKYCCPTGSYSCNTGTGKCNITSTPVTGCSQYKDQDSCNADVSNVGIKSTESIKGAGACSNRTSFTNSIGSSCVNQTSCSCSWNATKGQCGSSLVSYTDICFGDSSGSVANTACNWIESGTENLCDSAGKIKITYSASGSAPSTWCNNIVKEYPCSASVQLPFFDSFSLILSCLAIIGVYFIVARKSGKIYKGEDN